MAETQRFKLLINGECVDGEQDIDVINPATGTAFARAPRASLAQMNAAVAAAKAAQARWGALPIADRKEVMLEIGRIMTDNVDELSVLLTKEQGKPIAETRTEILNTGRLFGFFTTMDLPVKVIEDTPARRVEAHRRPLGVVAAIIPWNVPIGLLATKLAPALLTGNTVVVKTAPSTPLTTLRMGELLKDAVPAGVLNIIADANNLGDALCRHPDVRKIAFTGSTATGRRVMSSAAESIKRVTLELGGNDAAIILDDADVNEIAPKIFNAAFQNAGQICMAIKRLYVHDSLYDAMCDALTEMADAAVVGDGMVEGTQIGPLQNKAQFDRVKALIEEAGGEGMITTRAENPPSGGFFIRPTIVRDIAEGSRIVDEEQFGPVLPVIRYTDPEDALERANATSFGLGASIWSSNFERAKDLALRLEAGTAWVNTHFEMAPYIPYGGAKQSGLGLELSSDCLNEYTQLSILTASLGALPASH